MGIYVHIPFCRSKCFYCGFYSVASMQRKEEYVRALCREVELRKEYLPSRQADTLYFGGGTPSYLEVNELEKIVRKVESCWTFSPDSERTLEANPEDITVEKLRFWKEVGFNRLSIGVQSFDDKVLKQINRTHSARRAEEAVYRAADCGFENIGIDLIIGLPGSTSSDMEHHLKILEKLPVSHVSVYLLSIDSDTVFERLAARGKFVPLDDDRLAEQYLWVSGYLKHIGFEHYEISNFAKKRKYSKHNTSYWMQRPYLGLGAAAHSYDGDSRQWNVAHLEKYMDALQENRLYFEREELSDRDKYNECIMTRLRTMWGLDIKRLERRYAVYWNRVKHKLPVWRENGLLEVENNTIRLSPRGWLVSDGIFSELFI
ncbi:radical SAM family heme chaperone HemW [Gabonibacter chumensis]|uniref:radical SAM family heme chaperone HemW n=1 Tax=Gabonibacter chumensis TaxID=2972474 RepID=UPI00257305F5|nr:radical SAM family heme chaperone HemW [Gabonibacter chumensis]MCR9011226.1 radical SAM family heme chaperone HemW [Gabonibacter chumensis]